MSTKTTFKRAALVAVAALGLGVLTSVAPANASETDYVFDTVLSNGSNSVAYSESNGVEYATFVMSAGPLEKITLKGVTNPGTDFTSVAITGGTGTFAGATRAYKTGTVQDSNGDTAGGLYCSFSNVGTATASTATGNAFGKTGSDVELLFYSPIVPIEVNLLNFNTG